ncbi:MAG: 50S ribosomal protein L1 [Candidatus Heimdallarchaeota archaeon]
MDEKILAAIKELREKSKKRNFVQSFDLIVSLKEIDVKKPENRFTEDVILPKGRGEDAEVVVFSDSVKDVGCKVLTSEDLSKLAKDKRSAKKLVASTDFFLAEAKLMPVIGKALGMYLAPRGKMPKVFVGGDVKKLVDNCKKSVKVKIKDSPVVQCLVGKENMKDEDVVENVKEVIKFLEGKLPKGKHNIKKILLKLTMGKPVEIEV